MYGDRASPAMRLLNSDSNFSFGEGSHPGPGIRSNLNSRCCELDVVNAEADLAAHLRSHCIRAVNAGAKPVRRAPVRRQGFSETASRKDDLARRDNAWPEHLPLFNSLAYRDCDIANSPNIANGRIASVQNLPGIIYRIDRRGLDTLSVCLIESTKIGIDQMCMCINQSRKERLSTTVDYGVVIG